MESAKTLSKPLSMHVQLSKDECPKSNIEKEFTIKIPYHSVVGSLIYAMITIRPDIAFVVEIVSRFLLNLGKKHWEVVKIILRNVGCSDNRKSTLGYIFQFMGGAISWRSRLQECTTLTTTKSKYVASTEAFKEAIWLSILACDMGTTQYTMQKTKKIGVQYHFI